MEFEDKITWSKRTYAISDLTLNDNNQSKRSLPLLAKITRGFYGIKEEDTVDVDQMLVFNESGEETCVLARNEDGCCLSIPVNHPHRFQRLSTSRSPRGNHANTETQTLREILETVRMPTKVRFEETMYTSFTVADQLRNTEEFGALTLVSTHPIEYIQASPVYEGEIHRDHIMFIPNYRDVRFVIAEGPQPFLKSFLDVKEKRTQPHSGQTLSIIGYDDIELSDEEYGLVVPGKLTKPKKPSKAAGGNASQVNTSSEELYIQMDSGKQTTPGKANRTGGGNGPPVNTFCEEDFDLIVHGKLTKAQEPNNTGRGKDPQADTTMDSKPETGTSSSKRDSAIQQRFSRDYTMVRPVKQTDTDGDLQEEERDMFVNKGRYPMARSNSSVIEQARLLDRSLQVLAGGRPGGGKYSRATSAMPQNVAHPKGGPPQRSFSLSDSPPTHWREPLPLPNFSAITRSALSFSRPSPGGSNRCSTSSSSSAGSRAGVGGSPRAESPYLTPISSAGEGGSPRVESPYSTAGIGGSPRGESPYLSPIIMRKGSMCITTLEEVPLDLSGLSVGDVCDCLQLLHLETYIARFQEDQVDGTLLAECSVDDLRDMELSPLHAKKLAMFTKGWRPKV